MLSNVKKIIRKSILVISPIHQMLWTRYHFEAMVLVHGIIIKHKSNFRDLGTLIYLLICRSHLLIGKKNTFKKIIICNRSHQYSNLYNRAAGTITRSKRVVSYPGIILLSFLEWHLSAQVMIHISCPGVLILLWLIRPTLER